MAVRPGRETGKLTCGAADLAMPNAICLLPGGHQGNMHWDTVMLHGWYVPGAEIPPAPPINHDTIQCPNCKFTFAEKDVTRGLAVKIPAKPFVEAP